MTEPTPIRKWYSQAEIQIAGGMATLAGYLHVALVWFLVGGAFGVYEGVHLYGPHPAPIPGPPVPGPPTPPPGPAPRPPWLPVPPMPQPQPTPISGATVGPEEWRDLDWAPGYEGHGRLVDGKFMVDTWRKKQQ